MALFRKTYYTLGKLFLATQILLIIYARFIPERFFCWAPFDEHTYLVTKVIIGENILSSEEINNRYRYHMKGWEPRAIQNVFNIIQQYEKTYGKYENAKVYVTYSTNGNVQKNWYYNNLLVK